ncbi:YqeG family HAD IIIA-type phosphatase [Myxococcaceae bacterium GXIMD 01537]
MPLPDAHPWPPRRASRVAPDERLDSVHELSPERLRTLGLQALIFDVDNTLGAWGIDRLEARMASSLDALRSRGFRLGFLSNHPGHGRNVLRESLDGCPFVWDARKPRGQGFRRILHALDVEPRRAAMVGDRLFFDVWGAKRLGLYTILVRPIIHAPGEHLTLRLQRLSEHGLLELHRLYRRARGPGGAS